MNFTCQYDLECLRREDPHELGEGADVEAGHHSLQEAAVVDQEHPAMHSQTLN